jgi:hypothetical protein
MMCAASDGSIECAANRAEVRRSGACDVFWSILAAFDDKFDCTDARRVALRSETEATFLFQLDESGPEQKFKWRVEVRGVSFNFAEPEPADELALELFSWRLFWTGSCVVTTSGTIFELMELEGIELTVDDPVEAVLESDTQVFSEAAMEIETVTGNAAEQSK